MPGRVGSVYRVVQKQVAYAAANNRLAFPLLNYVLINTQSGFYRSGSGMSGLNNELQDQPDFKQLKVNDTVALQSFEMIYEKK